jgi:chitodextrinase
MAVAGYEIRRDGDTPVDVGNVLSYLVTGLTPDTAYDFEVRSYDGAGNYSAWSAIVTESTLDVPDPTDVAGLVWWLKADSLSLADGDPVATWADSSTEADDATQGTAGNRPTYQTNEINSLPIVRFDGTDDFLTVTKGAYATWTIFFVAKNGDTSPGYMLAAGTDTTAIISEFAAGDWQFFNNPGTVDIGDTSTSVFQIISTTSGQGGNSGTWRVGADLASGAPWAGDIAEIIIYDTVLSAPNQTIVMTYLQDKYGL